jgi:hypothetical protein
MISLANSASGTISIAVLLSDVEANSNEIINLKLIQKRVENLSAQSYSYRTTDSSQIITGKDNAGRILRFNQAAIDEDRVFVKLNGVTKINGTDIVLTPNTVAFNLPIPLGSSVDIAVYAEKGTIEKVLKFNLNNSLLENNFGAWGNLRYVREINSDGILNVKKWWIYSCLQTNAINYTSGIKIDGLYQEDEITPLKIDSNLTDVRFLLSSLANENTDRYLNFYINALELHNDFLMTSIFENVNTLFANEIALVEMYPPFKLTSNTTNTGSYIKADTFITSTSIQTDASNTLIQSKKIIGPI